MHGQHLVLEDLKGQKNKENSIFVKRCMKLTDYKFKTYKENGVRLDLNIAIDFTISNGNYKKGEPSLHDMDITKNLYVKVLQELQPLESYQKSNDFFKLMGFGARQMKLKPDGTLLEDQNVNNLIDIYNFYPGINGALVSY